MPDGVAPVDVVVDVTWVLVLGFEDVAKVEDAEWLVVVTAVVGLVDVDVVLLDVVVVLFVEVATDKEGEEEEQGRHWE